MKELFEKIAKFEDKSKEFNLSGAFTGTGVGAGTRNKVKALLGK